jgi:hypothetical protein
MSKNMRSQKLLVSAGLCVLTLTLTFSAQAISFTIGDEAFKGTVPENPTASDVETITGESPLSLLYKTGGEEGPFKDSYETSFGADNETATITYDGAPDPAISGSNLWLLVKDGADHNPIWYLFDLSAEGWNGTDQIEIGQLWPAQGAISHVDIFGGQPAPAAVPDGGSTMILLGAVLAGFGAIRRRFAA